MRTAHPCRPLTRLAPYSLSSSSSSLLSSSSFIFLALARLSAMAESSENVSTNAIVDGTSDDDVKYGFNRSEMYKSNLSGTVDPYDRHVFLCYKTHESWPSRVENSEADPLPKLLAGALKARMNDISVKTRLTICEGRDETELLDGDVLIFPEMAKYRGLKESDVDGFVEDVLVNGKSWAPGERGDLTGSHVFVCAHNNRDRRCGVCGPALIEKFKEEIESRGFKDQVFVTACSHIGGHKYAGNVIIFSENPEGKISGHWFGYVSPDDVPELIDEHIGKGVIVERLWRGQMGAKVEEQANEADKHNLPNGKEVPNNIENNPQAVINEVKAAEEDTSSCCQGANGFSCCREVNSEEKQAKVEAGRLSCLMGKFEQREVIAALAVAGAVATVAVAYSFYRRSS